MKVKIKKFFGLIWEYICFITELDLTNLLCTLSRFLCYGIIIKNIIQKDYALVFLGCICSFLSLLATIWRFNYKRNNQINPKVVSKAQKNFIKKERKVNDEMLSSGFTLEEKIVIEKSFIEALDIVLEEAHNRLFELETQLEERDKDEH